MLQAVAKVMMKKKKVFVNYAFSWQQTSMLKIGFVCCKTNVNLDEYLQILNFPSHIYFLMYFDYLYRGELSM